MRLNRFLATAGLGSRRACEELVRSGKVCINGTWITNLATLVEPDDDVRVNGRQVRPAKALHIVLHKPKGVVTTRDDEQDRRTIYDYLPREYSRLMYVGRLDKDSEGLIFLTSDGDLAQRISRPATKVEKEYDVVVSPTFDPEVIPKLLRGFPLESGRAKMEAVQQIAPNKVRITLVQGLKRQIREMLYRVGFETQKLVRVRIGSIHLDRLPTGHWRFVTPKELQTLENPTPKPPLKPFRPTESRKKENTDSRRPKSRGSARPAGKNFRSKAARPRRAAK